MNEGTLTREQFMKDLFQEWRERAEQYAFLGFEGDEYNHWLEHRHGWPITEHGHCGPSVALSLDDGGEPTPWQDCSVCGRLVAGYKARGGTEPVHDEPVMEGISCIEQEDGVVIFRFPQGVRNLNFLVDSEGGFEVIMSKGEYEEWEKAHLVLVRTRAKNAVKTVAVEAVREARKFLRGEK